MTRPRARSESFPPKPAQESSSQKSAGEYLPLEKIIRLPRNGKGHDLGAIHASLARFGYLERIVINTITGHMISGHGRTDTLQQLKASGGTPPKRIVMDNGSWLVPVDYVEVPEADEEAAALALNRTNELGGWEKADLAQILADQAAAGGLDGTGFDAEDVDTLLRQLSYENLPPNDPNKEWQGMPEFEITDDKYKSLIIHFLSKDDVEDFSELIKQSITEKTKSIWFPAKEKTDLKDIQFRDES